MAGRKAQQAQHDKGSRRPGPALATAQQPRGSSDPRICAGGPRGRAGRHQVLMSGYGSEKCASLAP